MANHPQTFVKSRENLQNLIQNPGILQKYHAFDTIRGLLWNEIWTEASRIRHGTLPKTKVSLDLLGLKRRHCTTYASLFPPRQTSDEADAVVLELVGIIRESYPGCNVDYIETKGHMGAVVEQLIVIDLS
jgi:hypothetical protein